MPSPTFSRSHKAAVDTIQTYWRDFQREARFSFESAAPDLPPGAAEAPLPHRIWFFARAMFFRLTRARRAALLVALALLLSSMFMGAGSEDHSAAGRAILATFCVLVLLALELADRVALKRDLELARQIQSWLLPQAPPPLPGLDIAFAFRPANTVAGDYYDVLPLPAAPGSDPPVLFVLADVAGKGIPAGLLTACFRSCLHTLAETDQDLATLTARLRRFCFADSNGGRHFTTAFIAIYDKAARSLTYVNAGHNPPLLRRASGEFSELPATGLPLGMFRDTTHEIVRLTVDPGDLLLIYTDGVVEAVNETGAEFGYDTLRTFLRQFKGSAADCQKQLFQSLDVFTSNARQHDDMTCLIVQFRAAAL